MESIVEAILGNLRRIMMNKILDFGNFIVQYWIEELPQLLPITTFISSETINNIEKANLVREYKICVELYLHKNAGNYGLLGFEFKPQINSNKLEIEINYTNKNTKIYHSAINHYDKTIYQGLLEEYVVYLKNKIIEVIYEQNILYGGFLNVSCAANSEVGSSPKIFNIISEIIIKIFKTIQNDKLSELDNYMENILTSCDFKIKKNK